MKIQFEIKLSDKIPGVYILEPSISIDTRGNIWSSFIKEEIERYLPTGVSFTHDKFSISKAKVLRGIHYDKKTWKLITCVWGKIYAVIVDCREESKSYLRWESFMISYERPRLLLIPPMIGNSYLVLSQEVVYHYKLAYIGEYYDADKQFSMKWNDPRLNIDWPINDPILSERDK